MRVIRSTTPRSEFTAFRVVKEKQKTSTGVSMLPCSSSTLLLLLLLSIISSSSSAASSDAPTVYDVLPEYGLPPGLLPDSVSNYSLAEDGSFAVTLKEPCYLQFDYLVYYDRKISGTLKYGSITNLKGIQVKKLFFWLDVDEIRVDLPPSDYIYFQVGWITRKLGVSQFVSIRSCSAHALVLESLREITMLITE